MTQHPPSATTLIRFDAVSKTYQLDATTVPALVDLNAQVAAARFTVLAGPSGSGKTTMLNLAGCLDVPDSGSLWVAGQRVDTMSSDALSDFRARQIGYIFQHFNLLPVLTAFENVEMPLQMLGMDRAARHARVSEMLDTVGLGAFAHHRPGQLSGGQRQRVAIARALVKRPAIVLADEPTANLDSKNGQAVIGLLRSLQRELRASVVVCSHDPVLIDHADDVLTLCDGRLVDVRERGPGEVRIVQEVQG